MNGKSFVFSIVFVLVLLFVAATGTALTGGLPTSHASSLEQPPAMRPCYPFCDPTDTPEREPTDTRTPRDTRTPSRTPTPVGSSVPPTVTATKTPTQQVTATITATPCSISFADVYPTDYYYEPVRYLSCMGVISGYADNTLRPNVNVTRSQLTKIIVLAEDWAINTTGGPHFSDVPTSNPFYGFVETAYSRGVISGYLDSTFHPFVDVTRGQISKIVVSAAGWATNTTGGPHFTDVPTSNPFYGFVETAYHRNVISGYSDNTFRWGNNATRGQVAKIVYAAVAHP
jgi:S-layer homology domain